MKVPRKCERCPANTVNKDDRFCKACKKAILDEMKASGYLTPKPHDAYRSPEARESTWETKNGRD